MGWTDALWIVMLLLVVGAMAYGMHWPSPPE
jgi:hypothetical protein